MLYLCYKVQVKKFKLILQEMNNLFDMIKINFPKAM